MARGLCKLHWQRWRNSLPMEAPKDYHKRKGGWVNQGYHWITTPDGQEILEHRYIMEQQLGRKLGTDEVVHHINGDKLDNGLENLEVLGRAEHTSHHRPKRKPCKVCGKDDLHQARGLCGKHYMQVKRGTLVI